MIRTGYAIASPLSAMPNTGSSGSRYVAAAGDSRPGWSSDGMPSTRTPPQITSSTRIVAGASGGRKSANSGSMRDIRRPFQPVKPGGGVRSVPAYHSNHPNQCGPRSMPVSAITASCTARSDSMPCTLRWKLALMISISGAMNR